MEVANRSGGDAYIHKSQQLELNLDIATSARPTADKSKKGKVHFLAKQSGKQGSAPHKYQ